MTLRLKDVATFCVKTVVTFRVVTLSCKIGVILRRAIIAAGIICENFPSNILCFLKRVVRSITVGAEAKHFASTAYSDKKRNVSLPRPQYINVCFS